MVMGALDALALRMGAPLQELEKVAIGTPLREILIRHVPQWMAGPSAPYWALGIALSASFGTRYYVMRKRQRELEEAEPQGDPSEQ